MPKFFGREPVVWIGIIVSCILAVLSVLTGEGVINDALAGKITDAVTALSQLLVIFAPIITAILARPTVTPVSAPKLPMGTPVLVEGTGDTPPPDAAVLPAGPDRTPETPVPGAF